MRLRHAEVFHAVYSSGSVTAAAKILNVTQPSVSKVLAHAEQVLGYALFERVRGALIPTPEAHRLFKSVSTVYKDMEQLRRLARNLQSSGESRIRVAATPAFGLQLLPSTIASFLLAHGKTAFDVETLHYEEMALALEEQRIDIGLAFAPPPKPGLGIDEIATAEFVVLAPVHLKISGKPVVNIRDLGNLPFIKLSGRSPLGQMLTRRLEDRSTEFKTIITCDTYHVGKLLVAEGAGITIIDEITAQSAGHDDVRIWRLKPTIRFPISVIHADSRPLSMIARQFVEHLQTRTREFLDL
ncbi:MAG: LysR substrate-binding domain-containing protein [Gammaproteobacteria bacterium]|nr:LysR substrate-binding domain-containing protein [Gammaproteobacteria bacterium]